MSGVERTNSSWNFEDGSGMGLLFDYRVFFTNEVCSAYLELLPSKASSEKSQPAQNELSECVRAAGAIYATLIYEIYPAKPKFKDEIDSSPELRKNFKRAKQWVDKNGYDGLADALSEKIAAAVGNQEAV